VSIVTLVSGGIDSTLMAVLSKEEGILQHPLFIDYGQLCAAQELKACLNLHQKFDLPVPKIMNVNGFGAQIASGITNRDLRIYEDAFLPGRNLLFLLAGAAYAYQTGSNSVAIGLLSEESHLFPDQTSEFLEKAEELLSLSMGRRIGIVAPLMRFAKLDIIELAKEKGITGTYSCHVGAETPCGICVSCLEIKNALERGL
jgi:7-cyano-7-deazaguanine synthase